MTAFANPDSRMLVGFDAVWVEKVGKFTTSFIDILCVFSQSVKNWKVSRVHQSFKRAKYRQS